MVTLNFGSSHYIWYGFDFVCKYLALRPLWVVQIILNYSVHSVFVSDLCE